MSILNTITQGVSEDGMRIVIAGGEKVGKSTLVCNAPNALLIPIEIGYRQFSLPKTRIIEHYNDVTLVIDEIIGLSKMGRFPYKSIIFDSITELEDLIHHSILELDPAHKSQSGKTITMESALGGYGRAYSYANEVFSKFLAKCDLLAVYGKINIIMTCHVFPAKLLDPITGEYDSWDLQLYSPKNQKTFGKREMLTRWADCIGFLYEPMYISEGDKINKGVSANKGRVLGVSRTPNYIAGNRFGMHGEIPIPEKDGWNHFANAIYQSSNVNVFNK